MYLDEFFANGNKLIVIGSIITSPNLARDLDYIGFTNRSEPISINLNDDLMNFMQEYFHRKHLKLDFIGRRDSLERVPYDIQDLPENDIWLEGAFLTGIFFPDEDFLKEHYQDIYGENYLVHLWTNFVNYVKDFPYRGIRDNKRDKDLELILRATSKVFNLEQIRLLISRYEENYLNLRYLLAQSQINCFDYSSQITQMIPTFIDDVNLNN